MSTAQLSKQKEIYESAKRLGISIIDCVRLYKAYEKSKKDGQRLLFEIKQNKVYIYR